MSIGRMFRTMGLGGAAGSIGYYALAAPLDPTMLLIAAIWLFVVAVAQE